MSVSASVFATCRLCNFRLPLDPLLFPVTFAIRVAFLAGPCRPFRCNGAEKQIITPLALFAPKESVLDPPPVSYPSRFSFRLYRPFSLQNGNSHGGWKFRIALRRKKIRFVSLRRKRRQTMVLNFLNRVAGSSNDIKIAERHKWMIMNWF